MEEGQLYNKGFFIQSSGRYQCSNSSNLIMLHQNIRIIRKYFNEFRVYPELSKSGIDIRIIVCDESFNHSDWVNIFVKRSIDCFFRVIPLNNLSIMRVTIKENKNMAYHLFTTPFIPAEKL